MIMMKEFVSLTMVALEGEKDTFSVVEIVVKCGNASWKKNEYFTYVLPQKNWVDLKSARWEKMF